MSEADVNALKDTIEVDGRAVLFGYAPVPARVRIRPRSKRWRVGGALRTAAVTLALAPVAGVVPPHAPWILGVLGGGAFLARRRWTWRFTLENVEAACPRCGAPLAARPTRMNNPHTVSCEACHHEASVEVPAETLAAHQAA